MYPAEDKALLGCINVPLLARALVHRHPGKGGSALVRAPELGVDGRRPRPCSALRYERTTYTRPSWPSAWPMAGRKHGSATGRAIEAVRCCTATVGQPAHTPSWTSESLRHSTTRSP